MSIIQRSDQTKASDPAARAATELEAARTRAEIQRVEDQAKRDRRAARDADRRARRESRRADRADSFGRVGSVVRDLAPLLIVNAGAVYGQIAYSHAKIAPETWPEPGKVALAVMLAAAAESIAVTVGWYAHDALIQGATSTAARLRRGSYLIAGIIGAVNYAHFATKDLAPTPAAIVFAVCSIMSPILWGLRSRRAKQIQLSEAGVQDLGGAVFSAERFRTFPLRTMAARRWSIDHNVTDPAAAWVGYNAARDARRSVGSVGLRGRIRSAWVGSGRPVVGQSRAAVVGSGRVVESGGVGSVESGRVDQPESGRTIESAAGRVGRPAIAAAESGRSQGRPQTSAVADVPVRQEDVAKVIAARRSGQITKITTAAVHEICKPIGEHPARATREAAKKALNGHA